MGTAQAFFTSQFSALSNIQDSRATTVGATLRHPPHPELRQTCCTSDGLDNFSSDTLSPQIRLGGNCCVSQVLLILHVLETEVSQKITIFNCTMKTAFGKRQFLYEELSWVHECSVENQLRG